MTDEPADNIVELKQPPEGGFPIEIDYTHGTRCWHVNALVDEYARTLKCRGCGVDLDPIAYIAGLAKSDIKVRAEYAHIRKIQDELTVHAIGRGVRVDGSDVRTLCGVAGETLTITRRLIRVSCKACRKRLPGIGTGKELI